jgi:hypothetical protein
MNTEERFMNQDLSLIELYEQSSDSFVNVIKNRKEYPGLFDVSQILKEDYMKGIDIISFILKKYPKSLTDREVYIILMNVMDGNVSDDFIDSLERLLKSPRYKCEVKNRRAKY